MNQLPSGVSDSQLVYKNERLLNRQKMCYIIDTERQREEEESLFSS